jgi:hypothetical protein
MSWTKTIIKKLTDRYPERKYFNCYDIYVVTREEWGCCQSCHEDLNYGYRMLDIDTEEYGCPEIEIEICCATNRLIEKKEKQTGGREAL